MLINTVILVLRDMLPLAVLLTWLLACINRYFVSSTRMILAVVVSMFGGVIFFEMAPYFSEIFQGAGFEFALVFLILLSFISLVVSSILSINDLGTSRLALTGIFIALCCQFVIKGTNFLIYFNGYFNQTDEEMTIFLGVLLAVGIGVSVSILLFFLLRWLYDLGYRTFIYMLWAMFISGVLAQLVPLLSQVDVISDATPLWNSSWLIADSSEWGHLLKALIGYETTPSLSYLVVYMLGIVTFYLGLFGHRKWLIMKNLQSERGDSK